jgi:hypothetical protein
MKNQKINSALALLGLLALSVYVMACTSFSPDDTKVLYPAFDPASGAIGMAIYDRESRTSEMVFVPVAYDTSGSNATVAPAFLRGQWLANGREIVIAHAGSKGSDKDGLTITVVPTAGHGLVRTFRVPEIKDAASTFALPLCLAGERLFLRTGDKALLRLDLTTGALTNHEFEEANGTLSFYPAPEGSGVFYFESDTPADEQVTFGWMTADDFRRTPLMVITNVPKGEAVVAYDPNGKILALLGGNDAEAKLQVWQNGQVVFSRDVTTYGPDCSFANAVLTPDGQAILASFQHPSGTNSVCYGIMAIPFNQLPPQQVTLIQNAPSGGKECGCHFQVAISHDGKTAAVTSTYLATADNPINDADCALFLVDLSDPNWNVAKVPIAVPAKDSDGSK